eukprot:GGOE01042715.1.p1 GENE.GGOE01042715.1~~GGOE01042715.1.p1  ORF type:complete len:780 (+),score=184.56 GGOE01042715.1:55-2394(+)
MEEHESPISRPCTDCDSDCGRGRTKVFFNARSVLGSFLFCKSVDSFDDEHAELLRHPKVSFRYETHSSTPSHNDSSFGSRTGRDSFLDTPKSMRKIKSFRRGDFSMTDVKRGIPIGMGGCATVYLGMNAQTGELIAIKEFKRSWLTEAEVDGLLQEYELFASFNHPHLVKQYAFEFTEGKCSIYMQYIPGGAISSVIAQFKHLHEGIIRAYTRQLLAGLEFLHAHSIVHRDVKPSNLLVDVDGTIKLADFGLARLMTDSELARTASFKGSPPYMSPEACQGFVSYALDIWAVGCTVLEMASGAPPWQELEGMEPLALIWKLGLEQRPPSFEGVRMTSLLHEFLARCFVVDQAQRPGCRDLLEDPFIGLSPASSSLCLEEAVMPESGVTCSAINAWLKAKASNNKKAAEEEDWDQDMKGQRRSAHLLLTLQTLHGCESQRLTLEERCTIGAQRLIAQQSIQLDTLVHQYPTELDLPLQDCLWWEMPLPIFFTPSHTRMVVEARDDVLGYGPLDGADVKAGATPVYWQMLLSRGPEFLDHGEPFQRKSQTQVLEHPALSSIRELLQHGCNDDALTTETGEASPILLRGVPRLIELDDEVCSQVLSSPDLAPEGLMRGAQPCPSGTTTNFAALSVPIELTQCLDREPYSLGVLAASLRVLHSTYMAIRLESMKEVRRLWASSHVVEEAAAPQLASRLLQIVVRTGFPLATQYGRQDNMVLTILLHLIAANMAGIDTLRFHPDSSHSLGLATKIFDQLCAESHPLVLLGSLLNRIHDIASHWN